MLPLPQDPATWPVRFDLLADAEPGLLARVLNPFAKRDLVPDLVRARRQGDAMVVEIAMDDMPSKMLHYVEGNLRQIVGIRRVTVMLRADQRRAA